MGYCAGKLIEKIAATYNNTFVLQTDHIFYMGLPT